MSAELRKQSEIVAFYIESAGERDSALLIEIDWLERASVRMMKARTDVATMRMTAWFISNGRQPNDVVKEHCEKWLKLRYKITDCVFLQSSEEQRATTPLSTYFHVICSIGGTLPKAD